MAGWNSDITVKQWFLVALTASLLIIYLIFITRIARSLHLNKKKIDKFVCTTLILIGISIILLQITIVMLMFFHDDFNNTTLISIVQFLSTDFSRGIENVGIFVDIIRLRLILIS